VPRPREHSRRQRKRSPRSAARGRRKWCVAIICPQCERKPTYTFDSGWRGRLCRFPSHAIFTPRSPMNLHQTLGGRTSHPLLLLTTPLSLPCSVTTVAGLHLRPTRGPDRRPTELDARRATPPLDRVIRPAEPQLDRLAMRRGVYRGILHGCQPRGRSCGLTAVARARISHGVG
jgi:hypothetical protein